ncbi:MAG: MFS transporter [Candidatus Hodarchaeota archaeon]
MSLNESPKKEIPQEASTFKMILFSTGFFFNTFLIIAFNNYVWTFYENELGFVSEHSLDLWPIYLAITNTIFTLWSMMSGPLIGFVTDKPMKWTKRWGFHTPWIIIGGIPTIIFFVLLFTPPTVIGVESAIPILLYYLIIVILYDTSFSLLHTHSFGAFAAHFRGDTVRRKAGLLTQLFTFIASYFAVVIWSQIIKPGSRTTFTYAAFFSLIFMVISFLLFLPGSKETDAIKESFILGYQTAERISFFKTMKMGVKQKNFMLAVLTYVSFMIAMGLVSMNSVNFVDDVLEEDQIIRSIGSTLMVICSILSLPIWIYVAKKIGHSHTYVIGLILIGVNAFMYMFINNVEGYYIISITGGFASAMFMVMLSPILADTYDEIAVKTKKHLEATLIGIRNFFVRISVSIQSFIVAIIHIITAYDPITPSSEAKFGLRIIQGLFPFLICIIGAVIFFKWYDLKGKKKQDIMQKMREMGL